MKEPYIKESAIHDDPESCMVRRKAGREALTGARTGAVLSRVIRSFGTPTLLSEAEGNIGRIVTARYGMVPRGRRPAARTEPVCARTGRSLDSLDAEHSIRGAHQRVSARPEAIIR